MSLRVALAQINPTVGDLAGNRRKIVEAVRKAGKVRAELIVFPELALTGYPPEDLLFKKSFVDGNLKVLRSLHAVSKQTALIVGFVDRDEKGSLYNAAAVLVDGRLEGVYRKIELPNYGVFDEKRYFAPGRNGFIFDLKGLRIGLSICEDAWIDESFVYRAPYKGGLDLLVNLSASPFYADKQRLRVGIFSRLAKETGAAVAYNNLVGAQDELVFDGGSMFFSPDGRLLASAPLFKESLLVQEVPAKKAARGAGEWGSVESQVYDALVLGTRDYVEKNGFKKVLIGLSGGIDSALVARIAVDALGAKNVLGVTMPSRFTSSGTYRDAKALATKLGIACKDIGIEKLHKAYLEVLRPFFGGAKEGCAEENLQARIRGNLLMAFSNKFGYLVLTTGNKSEYATGYCTLYGDMAGGFAVIKDVPKTLVFRLARYRNGLAPKGSIPVSIIRRAPSAELRRNQKDQDTLPPYALLDRVLKEYVEDDLSFEAINAREKARSTVRDILRRVDGNEYKRRQAPPGVKITPKAFGRDRRMPITNRFADRA